MANSVVINSLPHYDDAYIANGTIIIQTLWNDESIGITLYSTNGKQGFCGTLSKSKLAETANALESNIDDFMSEVKIALCTPNGVPHFTYHLSSVSFKLCKATNEGLRITYGELDLLETDAAEHILVNSIKINETKQKEIDSLRASVEQLNETFNEIKTSLEKCVAEKVQMEHGMLTKFAALLNAKKEKIAELEKTIKNRSSVVDDDFESDGSDSDLDYSSQSYAREKNSTIASSTGNQPSNNESVAAVVPKRRNIQVTREITTIEEASGNRGSTEEAKPETVDIYERETEVMLCDM